jgi:hypothetical protein
LQQEKPNSYKYNNSGIKQMKCKDCHKKYLEQTGRKFKTRYKEHIHSIRTNNTNTKYAEHILETQHTYGPITDTMDILHIEKKGRLMNTWEQFYIHKLSKNNIQRNNTYTDIYNPVFNLIDNHHNRKINTNLHFSPHYHPLHTASSFTPQHNYKIPIHTENIRHLHLQHRQHTNHGKGKRLIYILQGKENSTPKLQQRSLDILYCRASYHTKD